MAYDEVLGFDPEELESKIEAHGAKYARKRGWICKKYKTPGSRSAPDRIHLRNSKVFFIEYKKFGKKPTKLQRNEHRRLRNQGFDVHVVDNRVQAEQVIDSYGEA